MIIDPVPGATKNKEPKPIQICSYRKSGLNQYPENAIPINAIPTVAEVVQELPVAIEITAQIMRQAPKKIVGFSTCNP